MSSFVFQHQEKDKWGFPSQVKAFWRLCFRRGSWVICLGQFKQQDDHRGARSAVSTYLTFSKMHFQRLFYQL